MPYTLEQFAADCRAALKKDPGPAGRELCRQYTERACLDRDFVAKHFGPDNTEDRKILYEERDTAVEPVADDLASLALDLLLAEEGYHRASGNPLLWQGTAG